jgi:hypothetical protein
MNAQRTVPTEQVTNLLVGKGPLQESCGDRSNEIPAIHNIVFKHTAALICNSFHAIVSNAIFTYIPNNTTTQVV